ncbi:outer membrane lipoprotein-sorting protein [Granulicella sp. WH15]|uniref:outer membrane lipoprotein-sorting protein n=1 Tax=Granulicella sp. WH15 TaxID=2602070 RepID=UPI0013678AC7|nr:outer membrane lipoprotein-sorting protein [Granulicella sp. WH15]QHN01970.1 outer membrane lipoprotein-sorting protein [Granulicella sp. WH15]
MREWRVFPLVMCLTMAVAVPVRSQGTTTASPAPKADEIVGRMLEHNRERLAALESYTTERTYRVEYHGTGGEHRAEIAVHAEYTRPDQKHLTIVSESGAKFLCEKVLRKLVQSEEEAVQNSNRQTTISPENYKAELIGEETVAFPDSPNGLKTWVLRVTPRVDNKFTYHGRVWISQDDYAIVRIQGEPAKAPSWWTNRAHFDSRYLRRSGVWLPAQNVSTTHVRIGGEAILTIDYGTYPVVTAHPVVQSAERHNPAALEASLNR